MIGCCSELRGVGSRKYRRSRIGDHARICRARPVPRTAPTKRSYTLPEAETGEMELGLEGRAALVTGASKGIGKAIAHGLAREGVRVALLARTADELEAAASEIASSTGVRAVPLVTDIRDAAAVRAT